MIVRGLGGPGGDIVEITRLALQPAAETSMS
jgi:hypothetical protein